MKNTNILKRSVKKLLTGIMALALIAGTVTTLPALTDGVSDSPFAITANAAIANGVYRRGWSGTQVKYLQWTLNAIGYDCREADGVYSAKTEKAVQRFQAYYGLTVDGIAGPQTLNKLNSIAYDLQNKLCKAGYSVTKDSILGPNTRKQIGEFNYNHNISGDIASSATWKALDQSLSYSTPLTDGAVYRITPKCAPSGCVDESTVSNTVGGNVHLWQYYGNKNQLWVAEYIGNGYYRFRNLNSGLYLDKSGGGNQPSNVIQYTKNGTYAQNWKLKSVGNGYYNVVNQAESQYLDVNCCGSANGTQIQTYWNTNCDAQRFKFTKVGNGSSSSGKLNKSAVLSYAHKYAYNRNPAYNYYDGNNCCNYVSQCLVAGGLGTNSTFRNGTSAFIYIPSFKTYMTKTLGVKYISNPSASNIDVGDVIMTSSSHVMIVTKKSGNAIYANGNTNDRDELRVTYFYGVFKTSSLMK